MALLAATSPLLAQVTVDQVNGVAPPCGTAGLQPCTLLSDGIAAAAAGDVITVEAGTYTEAGMLINFDVTIEAAAGAVPVIDAGGADRHFLITGTQAAPLSNVTLSGLVFQNGLRSSGRGGAIRASWVDDLTIVNASFTGNVAAGGGAIAATGTNLTIRGSGLRDNEAFGLGGAVFFAAQGNGTELQIGRSLLADNAAVDGGAVFKRSGDLEVFESGFFRNTAGNAQTFTTGYGGAIRSRADATLVSRSTFANNVADFLGSGGGIDLSGGTNDIEIINSTFFENESTSGEGAALQVPASSTALVRFSTFSNNSAPGTLGSPAAITNHGTLEIRGTILTGSQANPFLGIECDGSGTFSGSANLIDGACFGVGGELTPVTDLDVALSNNGGPTLTLDLLSAASNAVDAVPSVFGVPCGPPTDQRRNVRPANGGVGAGCDIGAVEAF